MLSDFTVVANAIGATTKKLEKEREKAARKAETAARVAQEQAASNTPVRF